MEGIVLKKNLFEEGSEIITFYTRESGKIRGVARAIKTSKSKLAFALQTLFCTEVEFVKSSKLHLIKGAQPIFTFRNLRESLEKVYLAMYATEIILKSTADEEPNEALYDLFLTFLKYLDETPERENYYSVDVFTLRAMSLIGYKPQFKTCAVCGRDLATEFNSPDAEPVYFSNSKGGVLCNSDGIRSVDAQQLNPEIYRFLLNYETLGFDGADQQKLPGDQLHSLASSFVKYILERDLKSGRYLV